MKKLVLITLALFTFLTVFYVYAAKPASTSVVQLTTKPIRILLVPGHDKSDWGGRYGNVKEESMNLVLATQIYNSLKQDKRFEVFITRNQSGYVKEFADYFKQNRSAILTWETKAKKVFQGEIASGTVVTNVGAPHADAILDTALMLYGFNKWANENNIDAVIHVHFDDYPMPSVWDVGQYTGLTVYIPDAQMTNAKESTILGKDILDQLLMKYHKSTFKPESAGLVPDQKLIAMGSFGTLSASVRSVLIEYGYMYEKTFRTLALRQQAYTTMSDLTVKGIKNYYFKQ